MTVLPHQAAAPAAEPVEPVSLGRRRLVAAVVAVIVVGHVAAAVTKTEAWPFSRYTLYRKLTRVKPHEVLTLYGVTADGREFRAGHAYFAPLDRGRYTRAVRDAFRAKDDFPAPETLGRWADLYERHRAAGLHDGPPIAGMRLYRERREFLMDAANRAGPPDERELIDEHPPSGAASAPIPDDVLRHGRGWQDGRWVGRAWSGDAPETTTRREGDDE